MSCQSLQEALQTLQCHFTWSFRDNEEMGVACRLQAVELKVQHTAFRNRGVYLAMRAYLQQLQGCGKEALSSLREAERVLQEDHPTSFSRQALATYGNYAWIYYQLANYKMAGFYLDQIREIRQTLPNPEQAPPMQAQKGWSLLAWSFQNGEEAEGCFKRALEGDPSNQELRAGLAISTFATWTRSQMRDDWERARKLLEKNYRRCPLNDEVKVCLAGLLEEEDWPRAKRLVEEVARSSPNPEILRNAARVCRPRCLSWAVSILQQGLALDPNYQPLHYDLGVCYRDQLEETAPERREELLEAAVESFKEAVELNPQAVPPRLELAKLYSEKSPLYAEDIYRNLMEGLLRFSKRWQQAICQHWGDFLLHKKGRRQEALEVYEAGLALPGGHHKEWQQLRGRLVALAWRCAEDSSSREFFPPTLTIWLAGKAEDKTRASGLIVS